MENQKRTKTPVVIFAILYLFVGLGNLIGGADINSRFYTFDNLFVRFTGALLIISSVGLFFKLEFGRKCCIAALLLILIELIIGIPQNISILEIIIGFIIMLAIHVPGLIYLITLRDNEYFG